MTAAGTLSFVAKGEPVPAAVLVEGARRGDQAAWSALVSRYLPLVRSVVRGFRLSDWDADDVAQTVWVRLLEHLDRIREPEALPGWIATTARHESLRLARRHGREAPMDELEEHVHPSADRADLDDDMLCAERDRAVRDGLAELPTGQQKLLVLLTADPPPSYRDISRHLGMPVGSIGPTRARSLERLRNTSAVQAWLGGGAPAAADRAPSRAGHALAAAVA
jgi:RNA polymerase sigma factor (sigma-70 family)